MHRIPIRPVDPKTNPAWSRQPQARISGKRGAGALRCKAGDGGVPKRSCPVTQGAIPSVTRFLAVKSTSVFRRRAPSRERSPNEGLGRRCGRVPARQWASIPSGTHRRRQEALERANEGGPRGASLEGSHAPARARTFAFCSALSAYAFPMSFGPTRKSAARRGERFDRLSGQASRGLASGKSRSSLRRIELEPSLQKKEEGAGSAKAHRAWQRPLGNPQRRARTTLVDFVLVFRTLKTR